MKNRRGHDLLVNVFRGILAIILVVGVACFAAPEEKYVYAENSQGEVVTINDTKIDYKVKKYTDINPYRTKDADGNFTAPTLTTEELRGVEDTTPGEWLFAGWFTDEECTKALSSSVICTEGTSVKESTYYAKFVSADVLNVKCQITADTASGAEETVLRCISTVDSLKYQSVGLQLVRPDGTVGKMEKSKVSKRIYARDDINVEAYSYSPKVVDTESEYFFSATETVNKANFDKEYIVKPYWITKDGTTVWGVSRCVTINEAIDKNVIYIPVKMASAPATGETLSATDGTETYTLTYSDKYDADTGYAYFKLDIETNTLKSVTTYDIGGTCNNQEVNTSFTYRNLGTKYTGNAEESSTEKSTADDTWYTTFKDTDDEFVIATSADLYGLAEVVNAGTDTFANKSVYVVCDIEANKGYANHDELTWRTDKDASGNDLQAGTTGTRYAWPRIGLGDKTGGFTGTFDGQMHTISGIYMEASENKSGLFAEIGKNAVLKDFKLTNSYFNMNSKYYAGSIVGYAYGGTFDSIYSDVLVIDGYEGVGGLCGSVDGGTTSVEMNNCWFDGTVTAKNRWFGGLIGSIGIASTCDASVTITNCLNTSLIRGSATNSRYAGGLFGYSYGKDGKVVIENSMSSGVLDKGISSNSSFYLIGSASNTDNLSFTNIYAYDQNEFDTSAIPDQTVDVYEEDVTNGLPIAGTKALTANTKNLFTYVTDTDTYANESYWAIVPNGTPVLADFAEVANIENAQAVDTSWYNKNPSKYTLKDAADFYGFALLSRDSNVEGFRGKTVKLGSDIVMNEGIVYSAEYDTGVAEEVTPIEWLPIGTDSCRFIGDFDGQGNNISGVYLNATSTNSGLFGYTNNTGYSVTIQDFSLTNSYFNSTYTDLGSIVGRTAGGTFDSIYSDAIVKSTNAQVGGMIGRVQASIDFTMNNCWFDGTVTNSGGTNCIGGLVGYIKSAANSREITNCLNSRDVIAISSSTKHVGGLIGWSDCTNLTVSDSLNVGAITYNPEVSQDNFSTYGLIGGTVNSSTTYNSVYTTSQSDLTAFVQGTENTDCTLDKTLIYGTGAMEKMPTFYDLVTVDNKNKVYWAVTETTPILGDFIEFAEEGVAAIKFDTSWYDGSKNYTLYDASDLYGFAKLSEVKDFVGETVKLGADITIPNDGEVVNWAENAPLFSWLSIGSEETKFNGNFNGQGYQISGIYLDANEDEKGLFGFTGNNVSIQKLSLKDSYFESSGQAFGSIVGRATGGTFNSIYSNAIVTSSNNQVGGLIGRMEGAGVFTMNDCWFDGSVTNTGGTNCLGGLIGTLTNAGVDTPRTMTNCLNTGDVCAPNSASKYVGGLIGINQNGKGFTITNCLNAKAIQYNTSDLNTEELAKGQYYGLIAGQLQNNTVIEGVYTIAQELLPGVANGKTSLGYTATVEASAMNHINAINNIQTALVYKNSEGQYKDYWVLTEGNPVLASFSSYVEGDKIKLDTTWYNDTDSEFALSNADDFYGFALLSKLGAIEGFVNKTINLDSNITIYSSGAKGWADSTTEAPFYQWPGIGTTSCPFNGTFNGNKLTISGIYMNSGTEYNGLFNYTGLNAVIQDFSLTNSYFASSANYLGSIAGLGRGRYEKIYSDAIVVGNKGYIGGLIGRAYTSSATNSYTAEGDAVVEMHNCWFDGSVTNNGSEKKDYKYTGGLIGGIACHTDISNCLNTAEVAAPNYVVEEPSGDDTIIRPYVGGLVGLLGGSSDLTINYCLNTGKVTYNKDATHAYGAIVGGANSGAIKGGIGVYATTSSCSSYAYVTAGATSELTVLNNHVVDSTILGETAENTKLFATETNGAWTTVENATPVLTYFVENATAGETDTLSKVQLAMSNATAGEFIDKGTITDSISFTDQDEVTSRQGGCYTVEDGKVYYYQTFFSSYYRSENTDNNNDSLVDNRDNKVVIVKYDWETQTEVMRSEDLMLCHANDMTYNDKLDILIVAHANSDMHRVSFIDPDTLQLVGTKYIDGLSFYSIDYNSNYDCYVVQTGGDTDTKEGHDIVILNSKWEIIAKYEGDGELYTDPKLIKAGGAQGMGCDDKYIYCLFSSSEDPRTHAITVFDWSGTYVTEIQFIIDGEPETVSLVGDQILVNVIGESKVYKITF